VGLVVVVTGLVVVVVGLVVVVDTGCVVVVVGAASFAAFFASRFKAFSAFLRAFWQSMLHCSLFLCGCPRNPSVGAIIMHVTKSITKRNIIERIIPLSNMVVILYKTLIQ
jgi:hypothetical protein